MRAAAGWRAQWKRQRKQCSPLLTPPSSFHPHSTTEGTSIPAPLFVTWFQCVLTSIILYVLGEAGKGADPSSFFAQFPPAVYEAPVAKRLLPLAAIFVGMITFNNLSLKYVEVSFYNVARSLTIVFNVGLTYFFLGETTSMATLGTLFVVVAGFFVGSASEMRFSLLGSAFGLTSSLFVALNGIWTKKSMAVVDGNQWKLQLYNNVTASIFFLPLIFISGEWPIIVRNWHLLSSLYFWAVMCIGGLFGFLIGIVTILQIKFTSPLTHNISGTAKACVQTILALYIWGNPTNAANMVGTGLVLLGSGAYTYVRSGEMDAARAAAKATALATTPTATTTTTTTAVVTFPDDNHSQGGEEGAVGNEEIASLISGGSGSASGNGAKSHKRGGMSAK